MTIDLTQQNRNPKEIKVVWIDGKGIQRKTILTLNSGYEHGLLCVSCNGESLGFLGENGSLNELGAMEYRK